jgi:hypothetical protein
VVGRIALTLLLVASLGRADSSVPAAGPARGGAGGIARVTVFVDPVRVRSAADLFVSGQVSVSGSKAASATRTLFEVRDASGRVVFADPRAFLAQGERVLGLGLGFSSSAGPSLPALPPGDYSATWTLDRVTSGAARFTIGPGDPRPLQLERYADGTIVAHVFNPGPQSIDLPDEVEASRLIVDGHLYPRQGLEWDGSSQLPARRAWSTTVTPAEYGAPAPAHTLGLVLGRWSSNVLTW